MARSVAVLSILRTFFRSSSALTGTILIALVLIAAIIAPLVYPEDPLRIVGPALEWPFTDPEFPLGTDSMGRDMAAMLAHGARTTLLIGVSASLTAVTIGVTIGALAGYYDGLIAKVLERVIETFQSVPGIVFVMAIVSFLGTDLVHVVLAIALVSWTGSARLTRAEFLSWRTRDFVSASRSLGLGDVGIIFQEILPNAIRPVVAVFALAVGGAILFESGLSFLGLGDPTVSTWGRLVGEGRGLIRTDWYLCALPGLAIMLTVLALNLVSDGLQEVLGAKARRT